MRKEEYRRAVAKGKCVRCGKTNDTPQYRSCSGCREKASHEAKEKRLFSKKYGLCRMCLKEKRVPGISLCDRCRETQRIYEQQRTEKRKHDADFKEKSLKYSRNLYKNRIEQGLCGRCGKNKIAPRSKSKCELCLEKDRAIHMAKQNTKSTNGVPRQEWIKKGLCWICGKPKEESIYTICGSCRERHGAIMRKKDKAAWMNYHKGMNNLIFQKGAKD